MDQRKSLKKKPKGCAKVSIIRYCYNSSAIIISVLAQPFGDRLRAGALSVVPRKVRVPIAYITPSCHPLSPTALTLSTNLSPPCL